MKERKKYKCNICNVEIKSKQGMKGHIATIHERKKEFKYDICDANFELKGHLNTHVATVQSMKERKNSNVRFVSFLYLLNFSYFYIQ